jgi:capsular exopolysaccharide synthesis family protein
MSKQFELIQHLEQSTFANSEANSDVRVETQAGHSRALTQANWANDEALRLVQQIFIVPTPPKVVVFSGIDHGNGCTRICASVAETLARNVGRRVCLVEANFRSPGLSDLMGTTDVQGLTDSLLQKGQIECFAKPLRQDNLWLLSSGPVSFDSPSLLSSGRLHDRMIELREAFDFVIIDAPPLNLYSDAIAVGQTSDGLVLILEAESTRRETASAVAANLRSVKIPILAAVLNKRRFPIPNAIYTRL